MKFLLLCCFNEAQWEQLPADERDRVMQNYGTWIESLAKSGRHISSTKLRSSGEAATIRIQNGTPVLTDGPFAETREQIGGFHLIECATREEAVAIANRIPTLPVGGTIEVRPLETG